MIVCVKWVSTEWNPIVTRFRKRRHGMLIESLLIVRFRTKRPVKVLRDGHGSSENKEKYRKSHLKIQKIIQNQFVCKSSSKVKVMSLIKLK